MTIFTIINLKESIMNRRGITLALVVRVSILLLFFIIVVLFRNLDGWGDYYAQNIYPSIALVLSSISNIFPFSVGDLFILLSILALIVYPFLARRKGRRWKIIVLHEVEYLAWVYVWFYMVWGLNYSQRGLLERLNVEPLTFSEEAFMEFAEDYVAELNGSYQDMIDNGGETPMWRGSQGGDLLMAEVVGQYHAISSELAINPPLLKSPHVKSMLFSPLSSMVGVSGSMAPFFCEFTVNSDVLPLDYPATYTHEMAHQLGITSEAEANFYAYQVCTLSQNRHIRFSGYNSILLYMLGNARSILDKEQYKKLYETIDPQIIVIAQERSKYWREKYSSLLGAAQNYIYNAYLKSNNIGSGVKNYSEVIGLLISVEGKKKAFSN